ncbi:MAG TPA: mersacidin/lichenicidin family type 2 lantibiotic [Thermoanaerobaculia bacterium]|jgi:mersacidin/lichenicidin family type 2 lantibiotic|nr:mersacidin/lichenicidin family type 2 lantibiotic [Thermoanaerobaculia bacterium]
MKKNIDVARAFRDEEYFLSLSSEERAILGDHPSGHIDLNPADLREVAGGIATRIPASTPARPPAAPARRTIAEAACLLQARSLAPGFPVCVRPPRFSANALESLHE